MRDSRTASNPHVERRNFLVVQKMQAENRLRQIKDEIRDARRLKEPVVDLLKEQAACLNQVGEITMAIVELRHDQTAIGFKTAFVKMAKRILPRELYGQITWAAEEFMQSGDVDPQRLTMHRQDIDRAIRNLAKEQVENS
jgi:hypothetical protein